MRPRGPQYGFSALPSENNLEYSSGAANGLRYFDLCEGARAVQQTRGYYNSRMPSRSIRKHCALDDSGERTLEMAVRRMGLSARAHDRILKVARTVADLDQSATVSAKHLAEAVQYRSLDRNYWN